MKRVFGNFEVIFNVLYLTSVTIIGFMLLLTASSNSARMLAGIMALILVSGDAFHLVPRIVVIKTGREDQMRKSLGRGKQVASISMTLFYFILWHIGVIVFTPKNINLWTYAVYIFAAIRIIICLLPQNKWEERYPPVSWGMLRNIPFFLQGLIVAGLFFLERNTVSGLKMMWIAIVLSFAFYIPVVLWANKNPKIGMLMLPKTCFYIWMLVMCISL